MTSEEFELELADQIPVDLAKQKNLNKKQLPPDLNQRFIGMTNEMSDEAPTERKSYSLPTIEPMM